MADELGLDVGYFCVCREKITYSKGKAVFSKIVRVAVCANVDILTD